MKNEMEENTEFEMKRVIKWFLVREKKQKKKSNISHEICSMMLGEQVWVNEDTLTIL